jgi:hypothetical protein
VSCSESSESSERGGGGAGEGEVAEGDELDEEEEGGTKNKQEGEKKKASIKADEEAGRRWKAWRGPSHGFFLLFFLFSFCSHDVVSTFCRECRFM